MVSLFSKLKELQSTGKPTVLTIQEILAIHTLSVLIGQIEIVNYLQEQNKPDYKRISERLRKELNYEIKLHGLQEILADSEFIRLTQNWNLTP